MKIVPFQYITRKPIPFFQNLRPKKKEKVKTLKTLSGLEIEFRLAIGSSSSSSSSLSSFLSLGLDLAEPRAPFAFESFFLRPWKIGLSSSSSSTSFSSFFTSFESSDGIFFGESKNHNQTILVRDKKIMQIMFRVFEMQRIFFPITIIKKKDVMVFVGEQNLGPCSGLKYHVSSTIHPRRGNHGKTS